MEISLGAHDVHAENAAPVGTYFGSGLSHRCLAWRSRGERQSYHHQKEVRWIAPETNGDRGVPKGVGALKM